MRSPSNIHSRLITSFESIEFDVGSVLLFVLLLCEHSQVVETEEQGEYFTLEDPSPISHVGLLVPMHWPQVRAEIVVQPAWP